MTYEPQPCQDTPTSSVSGPRDLYPWWRPPRVKEDSALGCLVIAHLVACFYEQASRRACLHLSSVSLVATSTSSVVPDDSHSWVDSDLSQCRFVYWAPLPAVDPPPLSYGLSCAVGGVADTTLRSRPWLGHLLIQGLTFVLLSSFIGLFIRPQGFKNCRAIDWGRMLEAWACQSSRTRRSRSWILCIANPPWLLSYSYYLCGYNIASSLRPYSDWAHSREEAHTVR